MVSAAVAKDKDALAARGGVNRQRSSGCLAEAVPNPADGPKDEHDEKGKKAAAVASQPFECSFPPACRLCKRKELSLAGHYSKTQKTVILSAAKDDSLLSFEARLLAGFGPPLVNQPPSHQG